MGYSSTGLVAQMRENGNMWQQVQGLQRQGSAATWLQCGRVLGGLILRGVVGKRAPLEGSQKRNAASRYSCRGVMSKLCERTEGKARQFVRGPVAWRGGGRCWLAGPVLLLQSRADGTAGKNAAACCCLTILGARQGRV